MVKFAHLADCHLGGWRQEELQSLNFQSFQKAVEGCIYESVDFILISGDLFDSAYPPIEILKETFSEFKKIKEAKIPVFLIAGSHDFSASGKTFLDVLEKAGFCINVDISEIQEDGRIKLKPTFFNEIALFGYSGKKSSMEISDLKKVYLDSVYPFSILLLHTTIKELVGNLPIEYVEKSNLPLANYYAFGHIHQVFELNERNSYYVYPGPIYPNNFQELVDLKHGSFELVELNNGKIKIENIKIPIKEVVYLEVEVENGLLATEKIISEIDRLNLKNKIFLLKLKGTILQGKTGDIRFNEIEEFVVKKEAYSFLRNISSIKTLETEMQVDFQETSNIEERVVEEYTKKNPGDFNKYIHQFMDAFSIEKNEDEKEVIFEKRLFDELKKILNLKTELE
jgi:hypothetical protein